MVKVHVVAVLRPLVGGAATVEARGATLREVIEDLERQYPALKGRVVDDAGVRPEVCLAVGNQEAFGLDQPVPENGEVHILPAIAGGAVATEELEGYAGRLGNEIRKHRLAAGMTQLELARAVGTSQARLSRIESGVDLPSIDLLHRLGTALGVEIDIRLRTAAAPA